ncbi:hypothetical protein D9611_012986 [Ephemerocybe angulata]|uniref:Uncharacterized protein n=1 Tax=Ephemerocybe angulata TaxID=980116 RepID=A0A8H5AUN9_9AGAR|nr:hypothetical protein D9611_012986 [Tulosesus angulatus]
MFAHASVELTVGNDELELPSPSHDDDDSTIPSSLSSTMPILSILWPTTSSSIRLTSTERYSDSGCDDGLQLLEQPPAQCHNAASSSESPTEARNARARFWKTNFVGKSARAVPTYQPSSPGHLGSSTDPCDTTSTHSSKALTFTCSLVLVLCAAQEWEVMAKIDIRGAGERVYGIGFVERPNYVYRTSGPTPVGRRIARTHPEHQQAALESSASKPSLSELQYRRFDTPAASSRSRDAVASKGWVWYHLHTHRRSRGLGGVAPWTCVREFSNSRSWWWDGSGRHDEGVASAALKIPLSRLALREPAVAVWPVFDSSTRLSIHGSGKAVA